MLDFLTHGARLRAGPIALGQFSLTKQLGDPIDFAWPCTNSGDGDGVAFIKIVESGLALWDGPPFPVSAGQTTPLTLHQTISLPLGLRPLVAEMHEGLPPDGLGLIESDTVALTVVSNPILAPVGLPTIKGILAPSEIHLALNLQPIPILWACQNTGGGDGLARLKTVSSPSVSGLNVTGTLVTIPGGSAGVSLLIAIDPFRMFSVETITLTMLDEANALLGMFSFTLFKT